MLRDKFGAFWVPLHQPGLAARLRFAPAGWARLILQPEDAIGLSVSLPTGGDQHYAGQSS